MHEVMLKVHWPWNPVIQFARTDINTSLLVFTNYSSPSANIHQVGATKLFPDGLFGSRLLLPDAKGLTWLSHLILWESFYITHINCDISWDIYIYTIIRIHIHNFTHIHNYAHTYIYTYSASMVIYTEIKEHVIHIYIYMYIDGNIHIYTSSYELRDEMPIQIQAASTQDY